MYLFINKCIDETSNSIPYSNIDSYNSRKGVYGSKKVYKDKFIPSEKYVLEEYKRYITEQRKFEETLIESSIPGIWINVSKEFGRMYYDKESMNKVFEMAINNVTLDNINTEHQIISRKDMVIVQSDDIDISSIKSLDIYLIGTDKYKLNVSEYPITLYNYDYMKQLETANLVKTKEPIISKRLNPQISPAIIEKGKKMVKRMKKDR